MNRRSYHIGFNTFHYVALFSSPEIRQSIDGYILSWLARKHIICPIVNCQHEHIHILLKLTYSEAASINGYLLQLQKDVDKMLRRSFPHIKWPAHIWRYTWWRRKVNPGDEAIVFAYIASQNKHHCCH